MTMVRQIVRDTFMGYILWTCVHWSSINLYSNYCAPLGTMGLIKTMILSQSYHCNLFLWISQYSYTTMNQLVSLCFAVITARLSRIYCFKQNIMLSK
jgi:hypothetical protein